MSRPTHRREFLAVSAAALLGACSKPGRRQPAPPPTTQATIPARSDHDLTVASLAAALENLAVATYESALDAAAGGRLGKVPGSVLTLASTARVHHRDHAGAWNALVVAAGNKAVTGVDQTFGDAVRPAIAAASSIGELFQVLLALERAAAATYLDAVQRRLTSPQAIQLAAAIQPVEMQHVAVLNLLGGGVPVPDSFATTAGARPEADSVG